MARPVPQCLCGTRSGNTGAGLPLLTGVGQLELRRREIVMLELEYQHVDVFSRRALRGNGLVVVLNAASLPAVIMQDVTREIRQPETAFLTDVAGGSVSRRPRQQIGETRTCAASHGLRRGMHILYSGDESENTA
jgi:hypothetical protein